MAGDVVAQILPHQTHEVVPSVADMVLGLVLVPLHAHVAVDRIEALSDRAAALDVGLLDDDDLLVAPPVPGFIGRPTAAEAAADDQDVRLHEHRFSGCEQTHYFNLSPSSRGASVGRAAMWSAAGSCASSWDFRASGLGAG